MVNNHLMQDIVKDINQCGLGRVILSLNQEKAFDQVNWSFLLCILNHLNFGPFFFSWMKLFYTGMFSSVLVNGEISDPFLVTRVSDKGVHFSM